MTPPLEGLVALGRELADEQDRRLARDLSLGVVRRELMNGRDRRRARTAIVFVLVVVGAVAALGVGALAATHSAPLRAESASRPLVAGEWLRGTDRPVSLHFSDGAELVLSAGSRGRLLSLAAGQADIAVEGGTLTGRGRGDSAARYRVRLGPFTAHVMGDTRFEAQFRPSDELLTLRVTFGRATVSGCVLGEGRTLLTGEQLDASCPGGHFEIAAAGARALADARP